MAIACAEHVATDLFNVTQIRAIEQAALNSLPQGTLMQRAGAAVAAAAARLIADKRGARVLIAVGPGNNGGDALEAAALLATAGHDVCITMPLLPSAMPADAQLALDKARNSAARFLPADPLPNWMPWDLVIDGLFGIGLTRPLANPFAALADYLNSLACPVLAIDIPSGLDADRGTVVGDNGIAVRASATVTFIANKPGLHTAQGRDYAGTVFIESLGIDGSIYPPPLARLNAARLFKPLLVPRLHASHKGSYGDLTIIGGANGMGGAVLLAARMGAMAGAGRVYAVFIDATPAFDPLHPELMCREVEKLALTTGAVVTGPGLGQSRDAHQVLARTLASNLHLVIDADALNLIAAEPALQQKLRHRRAPTLLTPHPLEAARLLSTTASSVQADRLSAARALASSLQSVVILKGSGSVIANPQGQLVINPTGNPALASAGTGDVLSGLCGSLLAQQWPIWEAALASVWLHGDAADTMVALGIGPRGITAGEFLPYIRSALNRLAQD